jgi:FAD/FMN-containing dehydrogenase
MNLDELRPRFAGDLVLPDSPDHDHARRVWNGTIDRKPAVIARCTGVADVVAALRFARDRDLLISVRGGGHNVAGLSSCDGGIVLDLGPMKGVHVDPSGRTATAGPGVIWREFDRATQRVGLATPGGAVSDTGIAGLTLGGGLGILSRRFGLTSDNLVAADVVTADGRLLHVSETEHADLLWGLRGGGGNFGVVTSFTYRLHELRGPVLSGLLVYPADEAVELVRFVRDWADQVPDEMSLAMLLATAPPAPFLPPHLHGRPVVMLQPVWTGAPEKGELVLEPLRAFRTPAVDTTGPMPYTSVQQASDPILVRGHQYYLKASFLTALDDAALDDALHAHERVTSSLSAIGFIPLGRVISALPSDHSAFAHRGASWMCDVMGHWPAPERDARRHVDWVRGLWRELDRVSTGSYVNHLHADEIAERRGYDDAHRARLAALKAVYDPHNVFRLNPNVRPAVAQGSESTHSG